MPGDSEIVKLTTEASTFQQSDNSKPHVTEFKGQLTNAVIFPLRHTTVSYGSVCSSWNPRPVTLYQAVWDTFRVIGQYLLSTCLSIWRDHLCGRPLCLLDFLTGAWIYLITFMLTYVFSQYLDLLGWTQVKMSSSTDSGHPPQIENHIQSQSTSVWFFQYLTHNYYLTFNNTEQYQLSLTSLLIFFVSISHIWKKRNQDNKDIVLLFLISRSLSNSTAITPANLTGRQLISLLCWESDQHCERLMQTTRGQ